MGEICSINSPVNPIYRRLILPFLITFLLYSCGYSKLRNGFPFKLGAKRVISGESFEWTFLGHWMGLEGSFLGLGRAPEGLGLGLG
jgi:hypothetical protein